MIGIRREDKSKWEARAPLLPGNVRRLIADHHLQIQVQTSPTRRFVDDEYRAAGAAIVEDLGACSIILGIKEIPPACFEPDKTYVFFSHTVKRQPANMPMLRRMVELGCTLIDYERIVDDQGRRLVFFGRYAGLAGMIDALWALGRRLEYEGIPNPFAQVRRAYEYDDLDHAKHEIAALGQQIKRDGLPAAIQPLVCGMAGYGNVSRGAQEIYDLLPVREVAPEELSGVTPAARECCKVVFREEHMVEALAGMRDNVGLGGPTLQERRAGGAQRNLPTAPAGSGAAGFDLQDYYDHPEKYRSRFFAFVHHLTVLVNCIYWEPKYPRLVTCAQLRELFGSAGTEPGRYSSAGTEPGRYIGRTRPRLRVIADITCDIEGSIECNVRPTDPGNPVYVYEPASGQARDGVAGHGPVILAVDFLPCELPIDASTHFGRSLSPLVPGLARADFSRPLADSGLPGELQRATIVYKGKLTEPYRYLESEVVP